ncbi:MAG TPA: glucoamylase family protein [Chitinophagaceae bacterium]|nr:glucoamylase family protein [Chitinophagaceae bacterium]
MCSNQRIPLLPVILFAGMSLFSCNLIGHRENHGASPTGLSDEKLLDTLQHATIRYFWDSAHPVSGMAPERSTTPNTVTTGGSGFGISCIVVGVSRGWINRDSAVKRLLKITGFLAHADRYHGAWSHWMNGTTGKTIPFSPKDDGGDLVETAYMINGLLIARQYFNGPNPEEEKLRQEIDRLWLSVDWNWYTKGHSDTLFWHWSPRYGWAMNFPIRGFNECLITYILALSSPTHPIDTAVYDHTWVNSPDFLNGHRYLGYTLSVGFPYGGPLFFTQYSFLGLDPRQMQDQYTNYWDRNVTQTLINHDYCAYHSPSTYHYSARDWGLTASDQPHGYSAHSPTNDNGTITPTAALSAFPYTPYYSMQALRYFYDSLHSQLWGPCGFYDAFNLKDNWFSRQYLAIDEGPIPVMIENYRSGLPWKLFMSIPEILVGMGRVNIDIPQYSPGFYLAETDRATGRMDMLRSPDLDKYVLDFYAGDIIPVTLSLYRGHKQFGILVDHQVFPRGRQELIFGNGIPRGKYMVKFEQGEIRDSLKIDLH